MFFFFVFFFFFWWGLPFFSCCLQIRLSILNGKKKKTMKVFFISGRMATAATAMATYAAAVVATLKIL